MKLLIAVAAVAALGAVAAAIYVGSQVREDTVVAKPYEEGLQHDAEHHARAALGWTVTVPGEPLPAAGPIVFELRDHAGAPLAGATVSLTVTRAESSHGQWTAEARDAGGGRYVVDSAFAAPGGWELRFDVRHGADRSRLSRVVSVAAAAAAPGPARCDLAANPCTLDLGGGGAVTLELGPRPLRTMADLVVAAEVRQGGAPLDGAAVAVAFEMQGMDMGPNRTSLARAGAGRYAGKAVLVRCPSGRKDWSARVTVAPAGGAPRTADVAFRVEE
ncbi:FixH family protein [Anaeromyxobacter oryzae]|uniref:YtkA-like domain-containing protein n=1 Tax=Anaeromyxobacter oryzae TaxID=2918170 RepID=A0ABM7WR17_9BACT|nr:FixH family protein [Anaeromyxobacter oryzae]BDG01907.1 hypothetical protein AMOR_09030 [Anaeromyxobacter oryzae]